MTAAFHLRQAFSCESGANSGKIGKPHSHFALHAPLLAEDVPLSKGVGFDSHICAIRLTGSQGLVAEAGVVAGGQRVGFEDALG